MIETIRNLPLSRQIMMGVAMLGVVVVMLFAFQIATRPPMALLYSGLDAARSGEILQALDQRNISYEIKQQSIFVPRSERDRLRFDLAQEGLPRQSVKGYELLDDVNGFSVTSQMYSTAYWRAKEGELTRTILVVPGVETARVHIGANMGSGFTRSKNVQTASVTISTSRDLSPSQAEGIQYMVALAVSGLRADDVAVIDSSAGIIAGPNAIGAQRPDAMASDMTASLEAKVQRMLEARVGPGNAQVSVSIDVSRELQRTSSVSYDPDSRVIRQRETNDANETSTGGAVGALTVASNLPQAATNGGGGDSERRSSRESVAYEMNEVRTESERLPGEVQRISVAVLLNEQALADASTAAAGTPQDPAELIAEFERLVTSAAGLDFDRGDSITVELMPFAAVSTEGAISAPGLIERLIEQNFWVALQTLLLGLVALALGFGVIRPIFASGPVAESDDEEDAQEPERDEFGFPIDVSSADPFDYLKDYAQQREEETAALLNEWLADDRKVAVNE